MERAGATPAAGPLHQYRNSYQQTRQQRHGLQRRRQRGPQPRLPQRQWLRRGPCPQLPQRQCCTWTTGFASAAPPRMAAPLAGAADAPVIPPSAIPATIATPKKIPRIVVSLVVILHTPPVAGAFAQMRAESSVRHVPIRSAAFGQ
jgi:hypothetical protein